MRILFLFTMAALSGPWIHAQSIGLHMPYAGWDPLNHIIDRYNDSRPWLDDEMGNVHLMTGIALAWGRHDWDEPIGFDFLAWRMAGRTVESADDGHWRKLRVRMSTLSIFGAEYHFLQGTSNRLGVGMYPVELNNFRVRSKTDETGKYELLWKSTNVLGIPSNASTTFYLSYGRKLGDGAVLMVRLYTQLGWWKDEKLIYVNQELNYNQTSAMLQRQEMGISNIGFQFLITPAR